MKSIIVAYDQNRGIGAENDLLWQRDLPADLAHFREKTTGATVIMGRKTFQSIGRPLPNRQNIVVSRSGMPAVDGVQVVTSLQEAYAAAEHEIFVIGGGSIYAQALADMDRVYASEVKAVFPQATVFFPALGPEWHETERITRLADEKNRYDVDFVVYDRS